MVVASRDLGVPGMSRPWQAIYHPRLVVRLQLIVATSLLCLLVLGSAAVVGSYHLMLDARVDELRAISEQAVSIAEQLQGQVRAGKLTRDQAILQYRDIIRPIRYGHGSGYYFAYGMDGNTIVLGPHPRGRRHQSLLDPGR